jgi:hypothetical protein
MSAWLDMSAYPDVDPDLVGSPAQLAGLRELIAAPPPADLEEDTWAAMLARAVEPPDLLDVAADGFDDWPGEPTDEPYAGRDDGQVDGVAPEDTHTVPIHGDTDGIEPEADGV